MGRFIYRGRVETVATTEYRGPGGRPGSRADVHARISFEVTAKNYKEMEEIALSAMPPLKEPEDLCISETENRHLKGMRSAIIYYSYRVIVDEIEGE